MKTEEYDEGAPQAPGRAVPAAGVGQAPGACAPSSSSKGRDTAGKGGTIRALTERVSPRVFRVVALPAPTRIASRRRCIVQRYMAHFPAAGEIVVFDRSWYNRGGHRARHGVLHQGGTTEELPAPLPRRARRAIVDNGIQLIKIWLEVGRGRAGAAHDRAHRRPAAAVEAVADGRRPWPHWYEYCARAIACWKRPTPHTRPGTSCAPTTSAARASISSPTSSTSCPTRRCPAIA